MSKLGLQRQHADGVRGGSLSLRPYHQEPLVEPELLPRPAALPLIFSTTSPAQ